MAERQIFFEVGWTVSCKMKCTAMSNIKQKPPKQMAKVHVWKSRLVASRDLGIIEHR